MIKAYKNATCEFNVDYKERITKRSEAIRFSSINELVSNGASAIEIGEETINVLVGVLVNSVEYTTFEKQADGSTKEICSTITDKGQIKELLDNLDTLSLDDYQDFVDTLIGVFLEFVRIQNEAAQSVKKKNG